jgi:putative flippase GtrA
MYEVPISTIYIDGNRSSHFDPLRDSMRIYFVFVRFAAASLLTAAIDNGVFILSMHFWPHIAACQAVSRLVAGWFQFTVGKRSVFRSNVRVAPALAKYWTLVVLSGTLSFVLIRFFLRYTSTGVVSAKLVAETMLFLVNFVAQRDVVFAPNRERRA